MFGIDLRAPDTKSHSIRIHPNSPTAENWEHRKHERWRRRSHTLKFVSASLSHSIPVGKSTNRYIVSSHRHRNRMEKLSHASPKNWVTGRLSTILIHISCTFNSQPKIYLHLIGIVSFCGYTSHCRRHSKQTTHIYSVERTHCILVFSFHYIVHLSLVFPTRPWKRTLTHNIPMPIYRFDVNRNGRIQTPIHYVTHEHTHTLARQVQYVPTHDQYSQFCVIIDDMSLMAHRFIKVHQIKLRLAWLANVMPIKRP